MKQATYCNCNKTFFHLFSFKWEPHTFQDMQLTKSVNVGNNMLVIITQMTWIMWLAPPYCRQIPPKCQPSRNCYQTLQLRPGLRFTHFHLMITKLQLFDNKNTILTVTESNFCNQCVHGNQTIICTDQLYYLSPWTVCTTNNCVSINPQVTVNAKYWCSRRTMEKTTCQDGFGTVHSWNGQGTAYRYLLNMS
jgi:hypothetical protein